MEGRLENVPLVLVDPPGQAIRSRIDPDKVRELAESIREQGLIQPVVLRQHNGRFEIVAGHRRYLAHKFLGLTEIKALVKEMTDMEMTVIRMIENIQREDLSPIEEARAYRLMSKEGGLTRNEIGQRVGKTKSTVDKYLNLLNFPDIVQDGIDRRDISMDVGKLLAEIEDVEMCGYYLRMAIDNGVTAQVVRVWVEDYAKSKEGTAYDAGGGDPLAPAIIEPTKSYTPCNLCQDAVEIRAAIHMVICAGCRERLRELRKAKASQVL